MSAIFYKNLPYGAGGSNVEANPSGSATGDLTKVGIDGTVYDVTDADAVHSADKGVANGVASLDATGRVPSTQLPSYVDDVLEYASQSGFPATGESGKIYIALDTNKTYRWSGSAYVEISESLALGTTHSTAAYGDDAVSTAEPSFSEASTRANLAGSGEKLSVILGKIKKWFTDLNKTVANHWLRFGNPYDPDDKNLYLMGTYFDGTSMLESGVTVGYATEAGTAQTAMSATSSYIAEVAAEAMNVNDGTLTLNITNGDTVEVVPFSANSETDVTVNLEVFDHAKTATGNPITLTDASESYAEELEVTLEPIQDLHGYDKPWVGGAGKNKLDPLGNETGEKTTYGITFTPLSDGTIKVNGTATGQARFYFKSNMTFAQDMVFTIEGSSFSGVTGYCSLGNVTSSKSIPANTDMGTTFIYVASGNTVNNVIVKPMISVEGGDFAPYSNISPITGYTDVNVGSVGKNLMRVESQTVSSATMTVNDGQITINKSTNSYVTFNLPSVFLESGSYKLYELTDGISNNDTSLVISKDGVDIATTAWTKGGANLTITENGYYTVAYKIYPASTNRDVKLGIFKSDTFVSYEPYTSSTTHTPLGRTVYGGKLNVRTGELTVTHGFKTLNGASGESWSLAWDGTKVYRSASIISDGKVENPSSIGIIGISNKYVWVPYDSGSQSMWNIRGDSTEPYTAFTITSDGRVVIKDITCANASALATALSSNPLQVRYELATLQPYQLTPQELKLFKQYNYITTNGTTISLKYQPDNPLGDILQSAEEYTDRRTKWKVFGGLTNGSTLDLNVLRQYDEALFCLFNGSYFPCRVDSIYMPTAYDVALTLSGNIRPYYGGSDVLYGEIDNSGNVTITRGNTADNFSSIIVYVR